MAKPGQAQDEAMDAILASIRSMMSEDADCAVANTSSPLPDNVSSLFSGTSDGGSLGGANGVRRDDEVSRDRGVDQAIDGAMGEARESMETASRAAVDLPVHQAADAPHRHAPAYLPATEPPAPDEAGSSRGGPPGCPLMSPEADAAVSKNFNALASVMLSGSERTVDGMVEDILRPMLRDWLDTNLPPLVERLVRAEIERVARGRR